MNINKKEEVVKELSLAISRQIRSQIGDEDNLPENFDREIKKIVSKHLPDQPTTAELMEQIQALGGFLGEKDKFDEIIRQKDVELSQVNQRLERQSAEIESLKAENKRLEKEQSLTNKAYAAADKSREKAIQQLRDKHDREYKKLEEKHRAELKKLEDKRVAEAEKYSTHLEKITSRNADAFDRIASLKDTVIRTESSVAKANNGIQSVNYLVSLVRKSQKEDGLNPRQIGQIFKISDTALEKQFAGYESTLTKQTDRLAKGVRYVYQVNKGLGESAGTITNSADTISKSANTISTQTVDLTHATGEIKKESDVLNKLPQELRNTISSTYREESRTMDKAFEELKASLKAIADQQIDDAGQVVGQVRSFLESAKSYIENGKLESSNRIESRINLLLDQIEPASTHIQKASEGLKSIDPENFEKTHANVKTIIANLTAFMEESKLRDSNTAKSVDRLIEDLNSALGGDES